MEFVEMTIQELTALETAVQAENTALGNLGGTVDENVSLGFGQSGTTPEGVAWSATTEIAVVVHITQGATPPPPPPAPQP